MSDSSRLRRPLRWQRRFQYGLRHLMLIVTIAAILVVLFKHGVVKELARSVFAPGPKPFNFAPRGPAYSHAKLEQALDEGTFIIVYVRADWDIASVVNGQLLDEHAVQRFIRSRQVAVLELDCAEPLPDAQPPPGLDMLRGSCILVYAPGETGTPRFVETCATSDQFLAALSDAPPRGRVPADLSWANYAIGPYVLLLLFGLIEAVMMVGLAWILARGSQKQLARAQARGTQLQVLSP